MRVALSIVFTMFCLARAEAQPIPHGAADRSIGVGSHIIKVFTYKPANYSGGPLLLVFHGIGRNGDTYRDSARTIADRFGFVVAAPELDKEQFPRAAFQHAGIVYRNSVQPKASWTGNTILALVDAIRRAEGQPDLALYLLGHSAGAQMLDRIAAVMPTGARRIVIANPSSWMFPSTNQAFPYGYGGAAASLATDETLRQYLAAPITVYLGTNDVGRRYLDEEEGANEQGSSRFERGSNFYRAGELLSSQRGWPLAWRLVEVPGVGHNARRMFAAPQIKAALGL